MMLYVSAEDGVQWVRPLSEFLDGRFAPTNPRADIIVEDWVK